MPKRKSLNGREKRENDRARKRLKRLESKAFQDEPQTESSEPRGTEDVADLVLSEQGFIGLPPFKEKPLARVQASPCEKMHSTAPRLPSPRGSRLIVPKGKSAHPDSPAWVCTPARVPDLGMWRMPNSAGQTHLDSSWKDESKETSKKIGNHIKRKINTNKQTYIEMISFNEKKGKETIDLNDVDERNEIELHKRHMVVTNGKKIYENQDDDGNSDRNKSRPLTSFKRNVQGSFNQGDAIFGENAGTQCVAMSLAALAFGKKKNAEIWESRDMNNILMTGNELYSYLQRSSTMHNRYLLASELPQYFECFDSMFEMKTNESLPTFINLDVEVNPEDFNAYTLLDALQISIQDTDGCFVCFAGNTFLVGKTGEMFYTFDSHSRSIEGYLCENGKSTRVLHDTIQHVYNHILSLAQSMGYFRAMQCDITGVHCWVRDGVNWDEEKPMQRQHHVGEEIRNDQLEYETCYLEQEGYLKSMRGDDVEFLGTDTQQIKFSPLKSSRRMELCQKLLLPYAGNYDQELGEDQDIAGAPLNCTHMDSDGNCFFRAISFCLTGKQIHHHTIRLAVCNHLLQNELTFRPFLRCNENTVEKHILEKNMFSDGTWASEMEILALSHLLKTDIHTYSKGHWISFSVQMIDSNADIESGGAIYLDHKNQNHYDVVTRVGMKNLNLLPKKVTGNKEYVKRMHRRNVMGRVRDKSALSDKEIFSQKNTASENKLISKNKRYKRDEQFRITAQTRSKEKYHTDVKHRQKVKERSKVKYRVDVLHREEMKRRSTKKYKTNRIHRENVKNKSTKKYKENDVHRADVKKRSTKKYKENEMHREDVKSRVKLKYNTDNEYQQKVKAASKTKYNSCAESKSRKKNNVKNQRRALREKLENEDEVIRLFKLEVQKGPEFSCCCCHRLLFESQVQRCAYEMYDKNVRTRQVADTCIDKKYLHCCTSSCSRDCSKSSLWICFTCHRKILSGNVPAEAAANKLCLEDIPEQLTALNSLEQHLIALHIPFMKVMSLPQGKQRNIHGPVVCVPSDLRKTCSLPLASDDNLLLRVKLKRKLKYKGYFEYQFVNSNHIMRALKYLKENNQWYQDVLINAAWSDSSYQNETLFNEADNNESQQIDEEPNEIPEVVTDTCLQPVDIAQEVLDHFFDDVYNIAPGEGQNPIRMLQEVGNEAKTFPHLFPTGKFSWNEERDVRITLSRYFNNRLMNTDNRFAKDSNYIFFCQYMSELNQVIEKTQISVRKSLTRVDGGKSVNAEMLQNPVLLSKLLKNDEALRFMQPIRGTPAYWSSAQKDLFAMLRQLGIPTWFCSFSSAEYRWNDIVGVILHHENDNRNPSDLDWAEKNEILRNNPVTVARMFDHRFHVFQRDVILSPANPIGKVADYFVRVEFQQRGSPHMHCLYWVENAPKLNEDSEETICDFIDRYVTCALPPEGDDPELRQIVLDVQQHSKSHSKSCRKKGTECRFNFPRPPSEKTFVKRPCEQDTESCSDEGLSSAQAKEFLLNVWNEVLDEKNEGKTTEEIFQSIQLTQNLYEMAHNVISSKLAVVLKRNPREMWTNQYNPCLLKSWNANMDIQYILDPFSCIVYIVSYISKSEREMGMLLKQTQIEAREGNQSAQQTIRRIGTAYLNHREVSAQEAVYRVCNLRMKECSRNTIFIPVGENPTRLSKPLAQIRKKQDHGIEESSANTDEPECVNTDDQEYEEDDIWMINIVERYENRPEKDIFEEMCLAEFCSEFRVLSKSQIPKYEKESVFELRNEKGYIQRRTRSKPAIVRYPRFHKENEPEKYYQAMLQLFLPYWTRSQLKPTGFDLFQTFFENGCIRTKGKKALQSVKGIVQNNHAIYSKNENAIEIAQEAYELFGEQDDAWARLCPETELKRKECEAEKTETDILQNRVPEVTNEIESDGSSDLMFHLTEPSHSREQIIPMLQSLNSKQKDIFYAVREWCLSKISGENIEPLHVFVTGGAGTGKSHLIKTIHYEASRLLQKTLNSPTDLSVILTAFTGTAAFNIGGNTIHHVFSLNKALPIPYEPLKEQSLSTIRNRLESLQILIIDEVSMVYKRLLFYIHERLVQIKKCKQPFGGVSVIAVGDFYQLPPVKQRKDERLYRENGSYPVDYWLDFFKIVELDEIMRQREDLKFASALNSLRVRTEVEPIPEDTKKLLQDCIKEGPDDVLHVYPTNGEANEYNLGMLQRSCEDLTEVQAEDYQKDSSTGKLSLREKPYIRMKSDGLPTSLLLAVNARVMLTRNVNVEDGLVNGAMGHISHFEYGKDKIKNVKVVGVLFDSKDIGKITGTKTPQGNLVLIHRVQEDIKEKNTRSVVRRQFPLKLSWACTAHKVQGMTTKSVVVNLDRTFSPGQAYVAISRVTSKNGLFIETKNESILLKKIYADPDVKLALNAMEKFCPLETNRKSLTPTENYRTILLFNVQSLRKHFIDIVNDKRFLKAEFITLTETWLRDNENVSDLEVDEYEFHHVTRKQSYNGNAGNLQSGRGGGVGIYKRGTEQNVLVRALHQKNFEGMTIELCEDDAVVIVVYRPNVLNVQCFLHSLWSVVSGLKEIYSQCLIMGDFNEDIKMHGPIQTFLESCGFKQIVNFSTTEGATTLDHVYISNQVDATVKKMPVYFSYHEAVEVILKRNIIK